MSDAQVTAENKTTTFTGIVIDRGGTGLRAWFVLRNVVDHQGVEIMYQVKVVHIRYILLSREYQLTKGFYFAGYFIFVKVYISVARDSFT